MVLLAAGDMVVAHSLWMAAREARKKCWVDEGVGGDEQSTYRLPLLGEKIIDRHPPSGHGRFGVGDLSANESGWQCCDGSL